MDRDATHARGDDARLEAASRLLIERAVGGVPLSVTAAHAQAGDLAGFQVRGATVSAKVLLLMMCRQVEYVSPSCPASGGCGSLEERGTDSLRLKWRRRHKLRACLANHHSRTTKDEIALG